MRVIYFTDTTPEIAEYEGFFNVGRRIIRIDKPVVSVEASDKSVKFNYFSPPC